MHMRRKIYHLMQLIETTSTLTSGAAVKGDESENVDEFFDAADFFFGEDENDVYDDNVQFVVNGSTDYLDDDIMLDMDDQLHELGLMLNSTLASDYNGANAARLNAHFFNDWMILLEKQAIELGFPDLDELLKSKYMRDYVEQTSLNNGIAIYGAVSKPANEHILRRVADCRLNEDQKAEKRRKQRLLELKNPENEQNFLEGKRRILEILLDLKAYEMEIDYQTIRDEYMKRYNISLNASEHQRLFMNKSALKNFWRAFYREVILINGSPIRVRLRSPDVKIPEEITEDLRLLANIDKIELPTFALEYRPSLLNFIHEGRTVEHSEGVVASGESVLKKPTMDWGEEVEDEDGQSSNKKQHGGDIENANMINDGMAPSNPDMPADTDKMIGMQGSGHDKTYRRQWKSTTLTEDKYTDDEESADSSDSEAKVSKKYRGKKFKGNVNTLNISSKSSEQSGKRLSVAERSLQQSLNHSCSRDLYPSSSIAFNNRSSAELILMHKSTQSAVFNKQEYHVTQTYKSRDIVQRDLVMVDLSNKEEVRSPAVFGVSSKNTRTLCCKQYLEFGRATSRNTIELQYVKGCKEMNKLPYGSYSVPNSVAGQCSSRQEPTASNSAMSCNISTEENTSSYCKPSEKFQKSSPIEFSAVLLSFSWVTPLFDFRFLNLYRKNDKYALIRASFSYSDNSGWVTTMQYTQPCQPNRFQKRGQGYPDDYATSVEFFPYSSNKEVLQLSEGTQTNDNWLETVFDELGCHKTKKTRLEKLAEVIELIVDIRSPNPVLLSALPQIVGSIYGAPIKPEDDENYRRTWGEIVRDCCSAEILIFPLPNGECVDLSIPLARLAFFFATSILNVIANYDEVQVFTGLSNNISMEQFPSYIGYIFPAGHSSPGN
ncbi:unnamed protein product [Cercopithifilaria johnstoni]|uniref:Uncharacterized protein n=1 Tax=Cercopithifilaria johnstoni TaxID=2874296 RepID=A0A8J2MR00_9BILA|nr:unnamed protein product [Cercopithifilaria johnstoni]